jgi:hypothetical protein
MGHTCAVVVPVYRPLTDPAERLSLEQTIETLVNYPVYIVGPTSLQQYFGQLCAESSGRLQYLTFENRFFASVAGYNDLMLSCHFYQAFDAYEYVLIAQTDALVLSDALESWCKRQYSYIGAPWFEGFTTPTLPLTLNSVGNGGFSLRRVPDFLKVLLRPRIFKNVLMQHWPGSMVSTVYRYFKDYHSVVYRDRHFNIDVNEDVFWGLFVPARCSFFRVPSPAEAVSFAFEAHPDFLYELNRHVLPFGCHAWQRYQPEFWIKVTQEKQMPLAQKLVRVVGNHENY